MSGLETEGAGAEGTATGPGDAKVVSPATPHSSIVAITQSWNQEEPISTGSGINALIEVLHSGHLGLIRWDDFLGCMMIWRGEVQVPLDRATTTWLIGQYEKLTSKRVRRAEFEEAVFAVAKSNSFDSAQEWLAQLPAWDGVRRIGKFLPDYLGTRAGRYELAVGRYIWTAMVARILSPGCKADMVPVLVGSQGIRKSTVLAAIAPTSDWCGEACLTNRSTELARKVVGKILVIWEEMRGIRGKYDADEVKVFVTSSYLEMRSSAHAGMDRQPRRFIIVGTSNQKDILRDATGHRRYLPFEILSKISVDRVVADKLQLWAEALHTVRDRTARGESEVDFQEAERLAEDEHRGFIKEGRWVGSKRLLSWLENAADGFSTDEALTAIGMPAVEITRREKMDMTETLRQLGYKQKRTKVPGMPNPVDRWHMRAPASDV